MRMLSVVTLGAAVLLLGGCLNTYNSTTNGTPTAKVVPQQGPQGVKAGSTVVNVNNGGMGCPQTTFTPTSYQEVYTTEFTPCGPVVKKAIVPVYGQAGAQGCSGSVYNQGVINGMISAPSSLPMVNGFPPAQPVVPAIAEPVAWFGPSASPTYSSQTNWF